MRALADYIHKVEEKFRVAAEMADSIADKTERAPWPVLMFAAMNEAREMADELFEFADQGSEGPNGIDVRRIKDSLRDLHILLETASKEADDAH